MMRLLAALYLVGANSATAQLAHVRGATDENGFVARIPIAPDAGASIFISVSLNGRSAGWWALDSGASECIVDRSTAAKAGLILRGGRNIRGTGMGTVRLDSVRSPINLRLAGQRLATCDHFGALDLSGTATNGYRAIAGILGHEFFSRYIVRIDFTAHEIKLYDPAKYRYTGSGDTIKLEFDRKLPRVEVRIRTARRPEVVRHLIVDTGSEDAVDDSSVRRSANGPGVTVSTTGLGKSYEAIIGTLDTVRIGRLLFTQVPGVAAQVGLVGNGIWSRFVSVFDYRHQRLFLERPLQ